MGYIRIALFAALLSLAAAVAPAEDEAQSYRTFMEEGVSLLRAGSGGDLSRAIARFKSALKLRPESAEAYYWTALAYSDLNSDSRAAANAKDATIYDERMTEAWLLWGQVLLYQRDWKEALQKLETASRLAPDDPLVLFNLGRVLYHGFKDPGGAYAKFNRIWQANQALRRERPELLPLLLRTRLYMGYCEFDRGQWANAINAFSDALREQPDNFDAALRLALAYRKSDRPAECERILQRLLGAIPPDNETHRQLLAEINLQLGDLYIKSPTLKNSLFALAHLREFVNLVGDLNHPALEAAREYLTLNEKLNDH